MIDDADIWLGEVLTGRPVRTTVLVRVVHMFPSDAVGALMALSAELKDRDGRLRLLAGLALRDPFKPNQDLMLDLLGISGQGTPEARSDLYLTLGPWAADNALGLLTKQVRELPAALGVPTQRSVDILRAKV